MFIVTEYAALRKLRKVTKTQENTTHNGAKSCKI